MIYFLSDGQWMLCATYIVIIDVTFLPSRTSDMCCSRKWRQPCWALESSGRLVCALPVSLLVCMLISYCNSYDRPLLSECPLTQSGKIVVCFRANISTLNAVISSVSELDWSKTPYFSSFQMRLSADSLSQTSSRFAAFHFYINCIIPYTASTSIVPHTFVLYKVVSSILPSVGTQPLMIVVLSMRTIIHPW
jgi:hypothetical protein